MGVNWLARSVAAGVAATVITACSPSGAQRSIPAAGTSVVSSAAKGATKHLYVIVTTKRKFIAEYPIENGIPQAKPDRMVLGLIAPNAIAVDSAGNLYVLDLKTLKEFAPGASGLAKPIREIELKSFLNINTLAVDAQGYLYVGQKSRVYVYAPTAHGHATPIAKFKPPDIRPGSPSIPTITSTCKGIPKRSTRISRFRRTLRSIPRRRSCNAFARSARPSSPTPEYPTASRSTAAAACSQPTPTSSAAIRTVRSMSIPKTRRSARGIRAPSLRR